MEALSVPMDRGDLTLDEPLRRVLLVRSSSRFAVALVVSMAAGTAHLSPALADGPPAGSSAPVGSTSPGSPLPAAPAASSAAVAVAPVAASASASAAPVASVAPAAAPHGVVVLAMSDEAIPAARALAREVYGDEALRPRIDDATARVLAGEAAPAGSSAKLVEIADVRRAAQGAATDALTRRLFASLGADLGAILVVPVAVRDGKPSARIVSVAKGAFEPIELSGSIEAQPDGTSRVKWAGVAAILTSLVPKAPAPLPAPKGTAAPGPLAPKKEEPSGSFWTSPWTWVGAGVVVAAGVVVFAVSQSQGDGGGLRLQGRVSP